jgi:hypothetical protein
LQFYQVQALQRIQRIKGQCKAHQGTTNHPPHTTIILLHIQNQGIMDQTITTINQALIIGMIPHTTIT